MTPHDPLILGLAGRAGAGKDTAADRLCNRFGFVRVAFADALKEMLAAMLEYRGLDHAYLHEPSLKNEPIPGLGVSARRLMQTLGTQWGRMLIGPHCWADGLAAHCGLTSGHYVHDRIVVTDVRFPDEADWVRRHQGMVLRVVRRQAAAVEAHESEDYIDVLDCDGEILNHGSLLALNDQIDIAMDALGITARRPLED